MPPRNPGGAGAAVPIVAGDYTTLEAVFDMAETEKPATVLLELLGRQSITETALVEIG